MKLMEDRIRQDGRIREGGVLKVDSFLNHQMDVELFNEIGKEFLRLFGDCAVTKILTIEASGIGIACVSAQFFHVPVIFAKKNKTRNIAGDVYTSKVESFTHGKVYDIIVSKEFLHPEDRVCDAGCGLGLLSRALLPYCGHVTAIDRSPAAIADLTARGHDPRLTALTGDIRDLPPQRPYDAMVFCLFGDVEEALTVARQQCRGTVLLIRRDYAYHRFSTGRVPVGFTAADSEDTLRHLGLSYRMERFSLEFGQPFRSLEDAQRFFRLYDRSGAVEPPLHRLVPGPGPEFPYYLPNRKELCLLAVEIPAMEEA